MAVLQDRPDGLAWIVSPPAVGRVLVVEVDDATGKILRIERVGLR